MRPGLKTGQWQDKQYKISADSSIVLKDLTGTRFEEVNGMYKRLILIDYFQDDPPGKHTLSGKYSIPLIDNDAAHLWRKMERAGPRRF